MGRHDAETQQLPRTGRHAIPVPAEEPPALKRARVRDAGYRHALNTLNVLLGTISASLMIFVGMTLFVLIAMGPERIPGFFLICFIVWCFRRRK